MSGFFDGLMSALGIGGNSASTAQAPPNLPTSVDVGAVDPRVQNYDSVRANQWGHAIAPQGMGSLFSLLLGGDGTDAYNASLRDAQATKTGELNVAGWEKRGGGPAQASSPAGMMAQLQNPGVAPATAPPAPSGGSDASLMSDLASGMPPAAMEAKYGGSTGATGPGPAAPAPAPGPTMLTGAAPAAPGGLGPQQIMREIQSLGSFPAGAAMIAPYLKLLETQTTGGSAIDGNGAVYRLPGANQTGTAKALSDKGVPLNGVDMSNNGAVNAANAGTAGAVKTSETNAANQSDLIYKPLIAGATKNAELPALFGSQGNEAWLKSLGKFTDPTETRPGNDVVQFGGMGQPTRSMFMSPGSAPGQTGGFGVGGGASGPAVAASTPGTGTATTLYSNNGETFETGKQLAKETAESRTVAESAYQQRTLYGKMLGAIGGADLGSEAARRGTLTNLVATLSGFTSATAATATQNQVFDKMATQVAGQATAQLDQTAVAALQTMRNAYPNREMTPQALKEMIGQLSGFQTYLVQRDLARNDFIKANGTAAGFIQGDWMRANTPDRYVNAGIKAAQAGTLTGAGALPLQQFSDPADQNLSLLKSGTHFLDGNGVERIKP